MDNEQYYPAVFAFPNPFRLVVRPTDAWDLTLDDISFSKYDYVRLCRISASIDIGLPAPYCLHVGFNGCLMLPALDIFRDTQRALQEFNRLLGQMLLGGIYFEALEAVDIGFGRLYPTGYFRAQGLPESAAARFQQAITSKSAGPLDTMELFHPEKIDAHRYAKAVRRGREIFDAIPNLSPILLLRGVSSYVTNDWISCLTDLWVCIEQIIAGIWVSKVISEPEEPAIPGRREQLRDHRTWTLATRIELLFQKNLVSANLYSLLSIARRARNGLVHGASFPQRDDADAAVDALFRLISLAVTDYRSEEDLSAVLDEYRNLDPILRHRNRPTSFEDKDVIAWRPLPPIPGESSWGDREYEQVYPRGSDIQGP